MLPEHIGAALFPRARLVFLALWRPFPLRFARRRMEAAARVFISRVILPGIYRPCSCDGLQMTF